MQAKPKNVITTAHPSRSPRAPRIDSDIGENLRLLEREDPHALYQLTMHCRDRGHEVAPFARRHLFELGLISEDGSAPENVRAHVQAHVRGHGLLMTASDGAPKALRRPPASFGERVRDLVEQGRHEAAARELLDVAKAMSASGNVFDAREMSKWAGAATTLADPRHGRVTPVLQSVFSEIEKLKNTFSRRATPIFQELIAETGGSVDGDVPFPRRRVPYWLKGAHPLANFQSNPDLPKEADVVIVGAGLTGASAAYHLSRPAERKGLKVVVLDAGDPASQASGRNGGNFELIPENFFGAYGTYDGFEAERYKFLKASYPEVPDGALRKHAKRIAETVVDFALSNARRMKRTIEREGIDCDFSSAGWLRTSYNEREIAGTLADADLAQRRGGKMELLDEGKIAERYGFPASHGGRLIRDNGNYHPFKLVCGELKAALARGVELYTRTAVRRIRSERDDLHLVETKRGVIRAKRVIVATNAFTSRVLPELGDIRPFRSQISSYNHVPDRLQGISVTAKDGDIYANFPGQDRYVDSEGVRRGTLNVGNDIDTEVPVPEKAKPSRHVFHRGRPEIVRHFPMLEGRPPIRSWAGPMAFVEGAHGMRMPALGPLGDGARSGVFLAVWCNGYGGTGCHNAGAGAASWAITGRIPRSMPQDVFGPKRLFTDEPQFPVAD